MPSITSINVRVDLETKQRITAIAHWRGITISDLVREWYTEALEIEEKAMEEVKK